MYTRFFFMSGSLPRWRMFFTMRNTGQMNSDARDSTASIRLSTFSFGLRKSDRNQMMLNVITQRYTQLPAA
jgi:hypothetical protein